MRGRIWAGVVAAAVAFWPAVAHAGMRSYTLTDVARMRFENISFFLLVLLVSALAIKLLWNWLRRDFPRVPRLTYPKAVGLVVLWGQLFVLVLAMVAGARELLTPGAWEKQGTHYQLKSPTTGENRP